jgi:protein-L-isoaspartate O-methyltransferase
MAFGDTFKNVLILGAGSGTDVAAALRHGVAHVDAVEIDPAIIRLGRRWHPDRPYFDPRVTVINDDARHYLRTTDKKYDLVVFALIDSLTLQSSFSGSGRYMFTEESFAEVDHQRRRRGAGHLNISASALVDRLANTAPRLGEVRMSTSMRRGLLGILMAGPGTN